MRGDLLPRPLTKAKAGELSLRLTPEEEAELGHRLQAGKGARTRLQAMIAAGEGTHAEHRELARQWTAGGDAGTELVARSGGLIHNIAKRHCGERIDFATLVEIGTDEALRVIGNFDPTKGRLSTFLHPWVTGAVVREVKRQLKDAPVKVRPTPSGDIDKVGDRQAQKVSAGRGKTGTKGTPDGITDGTSGINDSGHAFYLPGHLGRVDSDLVSWLRGCDLPVPVRDFEYRPESSDEAQERAERAAERERQVQVVAAFCRMAETRDLLVGLWGRAADRETDWEIIRLRHHLGEFNSFDKPRRSWDVVAECVGMKKRTVEKRYERAMQRLWPIAAERAAEPPTNDNEKETQ